MLLAKMDELGKLAWLAIAMIAFWTAWPLGLAVLAFLAGSGRLRAWQAEVAGLHGRWFNLSDGAPRSQGRWGAWAGFRARGSGNEAFDAYREDTLRRLEEEQREFRDYLERLRRARDKTEFDQFMAERRRNAKGAGRDASEGEAANRAEAKEPQI